MTATDVREQLNADQKIYIGGFSGGIDSQAAARFMINRYGAENVVLCNSTAGENEHPLTVEHVAWYSANVHFVHSTNAKIVDMAGRAPEKIAELGLKPDDPLTFDTLALLKQRFPSRRAQFCTEHLKLQPMRRFVRERYAIALARGNVVRFSGMRRSESEARKNIPFQCEDDFFECDVKHPLADWTKEMCFIYVKHHGEQINPLYTLGFNRVGCAPCINSGKDDILAWAQRFPKMIDKVRTWEKRVGRAFFAPCVPGKEINWVDEVVEWAKTVHGGRQYSLHVEQERPACESAYGLCE